MFPLFTYKVLEPAESISSHYKSHKLNMIYGITKYFLYR